MTDFPTIARYAVIGNPIAHSRSPDIHQLFAAQTQRTLEYDKILAEPDEFSTVMPAFFEQGGLGLNVTVPFKQEAYVLSQILSARAAAAGAVNTLWLQNGLLHGCNTDGIGLVRDLNRLDAQLDGAQVLLVGAGGAARGVLQPLLEAGCAHIHIVNRTERRAHELREGWLSALADHGLPSTHFDEHALSAGSLLSAGTGSWDIVINATASSLQGQAPELPPDIYRPDSLAYDMVYGPEDTPFMRVARIHGAARCADGLGMLIEQAAESFYLWHGLRPDTQATLETMRATWSAART
ncbi:MAG: shikimate dehydrogenase [Corticimicrobacter sp.]|uniref:shikimate dehydrogenase n=1 Tax=Corticimicrobacter sp. TaxID=2678536 RepID=UPI0032DBBC58